MRAFLYLMAFLFVVLMIGTAANPVVPIVAFTAMFVLYLVVRVVLAARS